MYEKKKEKQEKIHQFGAEHIHLRMCICMYIHVSLIPINLSHILHATVLARFISSGCTEKDSDNRVVQRINERGKYCLCTEKREQVLDI